MDSPVSRFAATSTDSSWAQSYSAGKLNIVLSLEGNIEEIELTSLGKETLEKLQREFFAIDKKSLENLKKVTGDVAKTVPAEITLSLVLATIVGDILYIVTADLGYAVLKRGKSISVIAEGKKGEILGFSGKIQPQDTVLLGTADLFKTISPADIGKALYLSTPDEIGENLAPFLHEKAKGTEAGITWKIPGQLLQEAQEDTEDMYKVDEKQKSTKPSALNEVKSRALNLLRFVPTPKKLNKKHIIVIAAAVLVIFLVGSIFIEQNSKKQNEELSRAQELIDQNKPKYEDALALMFINKSLAVDDLTDVKDTIEKGSKKISSNSKAGKKLQEFLNEINSALGGEGGTSQVALFFDSKGKEVENVSVISTKGEIISLGTNNKGGILSSSGSLEETFDADSADGITADEKNIFILSENSVVQIPRSSLKPKSIIDSDNNPISIDTFGGNIYLLSKDDKAVYRYRANNFSQESYLSKDVKLENPVSMAIDSSIYVIDGGKIRKFTRGLEDNFSIKNGISFSDSSKIFTDIDYTNLYILDPDKKVAYIIDKTGNPVSEFSLKGLKNITSIAASEKDNKIYVVSDGNIYSISF